MSDFACEQFDIISQNADHTDHLGRSLGHLLQPGDVICLAGNLGAGKTALTRGIGAAWGAVELVTSPTFTLVHEHRRPTDGAILYHVDCYRLGSADDAWGIGLEDMLHDDGIVIIEWPENIQAALPAERLWVALAFLDDTQRQITVSAAGARYQTLCAAWRDRVLAP